MHKKLLIILSIFTLLLTNVKSDEIVIKQLKKGGNIVFIRHAIAPGGGDPENFRLDDCSTQRNLDSQGIEQSKKMGLFFQQNNIPIDKVLSSEWCRCKDTAKFAFKDYETFNALNSFFSSKFKENKEKQMKEKFNPKHTFIGAMANNIDQLRYGEGDDLNVHNKYEGRIIEEIAKTENKHPIDVFLDISLSENLSSRWVTPPQKIEMEAMSRLANHPFSVTGLSDG